MKTRFHANRVPLMLVITLWMLAILACSRSVQYQTPPATPILIPNYPRLVETAHSDDSTGFIGGGATAFDEPTFLPPDAETLLETPIENILPEAEVILPTEEVTPEPSMTPTEKPPIMYYTQSGDTLDLVASRFAVSKEEIIIPSEIRRDGLLMPNQLLLIPDRLEGISYHNLILPDSSVIYSPAALGFDTHEYVKTMGGYLSTYKDWGVNGWRSGSDVIQHLASVNAINPMLLLSLLDYQSKWVSAEPSTMLTTDYPMGYLSFDKKGLYNQTSWVIKQLSIGYYHWRAGSLRTITLKDGTSIPLAPELNAGSVAIMYLFSQTMNLEQWENALYGPENLAHHYQQMFENPWETAQRIEPLFPANLAQPTLELPFEPGHIWSLTGGPHSAWDEGGALAALDFAPASMESGCVDSPEWVTAVADGLIIRSENGVVMLDLDGDSQEETGWVILYLHVATNGRISNGMWVKQGDRIGHPSCEGGRSTGTHVHIARRYNGEWVLADQQLPFVLSGWEAHAGDAPYQGAMIKGDTIVSASINGTHNSNISR